MPCKTWSYSIADRGAGQQERLREGSLCLSKVEKEMPRVRLDLPGKIGPSCRSYCLGFVHSGFIYVFSVCIFVLKQIANLVKKGLLY